jgi:hypothetical protein
MALTKKLQEVIEIEIELALIGAKKARGEILKEEAKNNVVPAKETGGLKWKSSSNISLTKSMKLSTFVEKKT